MRQRRLTPNQSLIIVNALLLGALGYVTFMPESTAHAQPARARGDYTMVAGEVSFGNSSAVWIVDSANQELVAVRWNEGKKNFDGIGYANLQEDAKERPGR